jgi:hypothetical protein
VPISFRRPPRLRIELVFQFKVSASVACTTMTALWLPKEYFYPELWLLWPFFGGV